MTGGSPVELVMLQPAQIQAPSLPTSNDSPTTLAPGSDSSTSTSPSSPVGPPAPQPAAAATSNGTTAPAPSSTGPSPTSHGLPRWALTVKAVLTTCSGAIKFAIAVLGVWAAYTAWQSLKLQRWTASNDALQSCQAAKSRSEYCNRTVAVGVRPPPSSKRDVGVIIEWNLLVSALGDAHSRSPLVLAASIVLTVATILLATILIRPQSEVFRPIVSNVRSFPLDVTGDHIYLHTSRWVSTFWSALGLWLEIFRNLADAVVIGIVLDDDDTDDLAKHGKRICVSYESDDDEYVNDNDPINDDVPIKDNEHTDEEKQVENAAGKSPGYPSLSASELLEIDDSFRQLLGSRAEKDLPSNVIFLSRLPAKKDIRYGLQELQWQSLLHFLDCLVGPERRLKDLPDSLGCILARLGLTMGRKTFSDGPLANQICPRVPVRQRMLLDVLEELLERRGADSENQDLWERANDCCIPRSSRINRVLRDNLLSTWSSSGFDCRSTVLSLESIIRQEEVRRAHWAPVSEEQKSDIPLSRNVHPNPPSLATRKEVTQPPGKAKRGWPRKSMLSSGKGLFK